MDRIMLVTKLSHKGVQNFAEQSSGHDLIGRCLHNTEIAQFLEKPFYLFIRIFMDTADSSRWIANWMR